MGCLPRHVLADLADRLATARGHHTTAEHPDGTLRVAPADDPTNTRWVSITTDPAATRTAIRDTGINPDAMIIIAAVGYGRYGRERHRLDLDVLCAINTVADTHQVKRHAVGDWLAAEGATGTDLRPADVIDQFAQAYAGAFPSELDYTRHRMAELGWTAALCAADISEDYLDVTVITRDWFTATFGTSTAASPGVSRCCAGSLDPNRTANRSGDRSAPSDPRRPPTQSPTRHSERGSLMNRTDQHRRPLTAAELETIRQRIRDAADTRHLLNDALGAVYTALLADTSGTLDTFGDEHRLDVTKFAIPTAQWTAIVAAITRRAEQWGTSATLALELVNLMPSSYDDPNTATPDLDLPDYRPTTYRLHVHRDAVDVIAACEAHLTALHDCYGATSTIFQQAWHSWHRHLVGLFTRTTEVDTHISKDGPKSLYVQTSSGLVYALIFHGATRHCTTPGCAAVIDDTGTARALHSTATILDHAHTPSYPTGDPQPGEWAFHS